MGSQKIIINRIWAMPNKNTFKIKPIKEILDKYIDKEWMIVIDPFANDSKIGTITNDLNPEYDTDFHKDALNFLHDFDNGIADVILYDPPYSITQASQLYKNYGGERLKINVSNMKYWAECKNEIMRILKPGGLVISFGWNSNGLGKSRGFKMIEILLVPHGGSKNDTIVTIEEKK